MPIYREISPEEVAKLKFKGTEGEHVLRCKVDEERNEVRCTLDGDVTITISEDVFKKMSISRLQKGNFVISEPYGKKISSMGEVWVEWI